MRLSLALALSLALSNGLGSAALAHDGVNHATPAETAEHAAASGPALPFPLQIRPRFSLIDTTRHAVTEADFAGRPMAIFFGYANCKSICSVALPRMGEALDLLGDQAAQFAAIMITVDPARDTPEVMGRRLQTYHPGLIGLTGSEAALADARAAFQVEVKKVAETADGAPIYAHGSFVYLVGRDGVVNSVLPPILSAERLAELMRKQI